MAPTGTKPLAVVTGASDGIGYELARVFADNGFDLVVCAEDGGIVEAAQAFAASGARVESVQADLATYEGNERLVERVRSLGRPVDALALNAGIGVGGPFIETDLEADLRLIALNIGSPVHLAKRFLPEMVRRGSGRVLITSSIASTMPAPFEATYGGSKAFDQSFAQALREELKETGVTVTSLMPGPTETNFFHRAGLDDTKVGAAEKDDPGKVALQGFEALMAGKDHVVAGSLKNRVQAMGAKVLPETAKAKLHRDMAEPGSAKK
ncbi:MAG TPA: SDR family NAD(P)-dependent oxidoreductase [Myxococcales bacterium]|jgi:short-subunit dehydrogenase|nr:SDR family NAD(P)-dependent oxidoreductase [Myxococcales bacterium]